MITSSENAENAGLERGASDCDFVMMMRKENPGANRVHQTHDLLKTKRGK